MAWARFDDNYTLNPKILAAGPWSELLDVRAIIWCARYETDGFIADDVLPVIGMAIPSVRNKAVRLCEVGRWQKVAGGWSVLNYLEYNPSHEQCEKRRSDGKERAARSRERNAKNERTFAVGSGDPRGGDGLSSSLQNRDNCQLCDFHGFVLDAHGDVLLNANGELTQCTHAQPSTNVRHIRSSSEAVS